MISLAAIPVFVIFLLVAKRCDIKVKKDTLIVMLLVILLGIAIGIYDYKISLTDVIQIERPDIDASETTEELTVISEYGKDKENVEISPKKISDKEAKKRIELAKQEIDQTFLGDNKDINNITENIVMKSKYADDKVKAEWSLDDYQVIDSLGNIIPENINEDVIVRAFCKLESGNMEDTYSFPFVVTVPSVDTKSGYHYLVKKALDENDKLVAKDDMYKLPTQIEGMKIRWFRENRYRGLYVALLGVVIGILKILDEKEKLKKRKKEINKALERDYPDIVSNLSLYVGAGISIKIAFNRMSDNYLSRKERGLIAIRTGFEEIVKLNNQIKDGVGELEAYREFGQKIAHKDYRKLSLLLVQNLRKGNGQLASLLENEEKIAFDNRKLKAKIAGEEASTKLLVPMFGLLLIVLVILIFPVILGLNF